MAKSGPFGFPVPGGRQKRYLDRLKKSRDFYGETMRQYIEVLKTHATNAGRLEATGKEEGWDFYDSSLEGLGGYFNEKSDWPPSFNGIGGFTLESFKRHCAERKEMLKRQRPPKKFLALDLFGQGGGVSRCRSRQSNNHDTYAERKIGSGH